MANSYVETSLQSNIDIAKGQYFAPEHLTVLMVYFGFNALVLGNLRIFHQIQTH